MFEENRNAEMVEMQRLEEQERRRREEKVCLFPMLLRDSVISLRFDLFEPPSGGA